MNRSIAVVGGSADFWLHLGAEVVDPSPIPAVPVTSQAEVRRMS